MLRVYKDVWSRWDFEFWSGGKDTVNDLTDGEVEQIFTMLEECYPDGMEETEVNDFFWFERDTIAEWLGYRDFDEIINRNKDEDEDEEEDESE